MRRQGVAIVPARDGRGTNALAWRRGIAMTLHFGDASFAPHAASARAAGIEPAILRLPGLGLDIDRPDDLATFRAMPDAAHTRARALLDRAAAADSALPMEAAG